MTSAVERKIICRAGAREPASDKRNLIRLWSFPDELARSNRINGNRDIRLVPPGAAAISDESMDFDIRYRSTGANVASCAKELGPGKQAVVHVTVKARKPMNNAFTVDVEDYFHVTAFSNAIDTRSWSERESRVERNTHAILCLLEQRGITGTFFVLGWVAQRYPALIREIARQGHEIASHGMNHQLIYRQSEAEFRAETRTSKALLEDIVQRQVIGYRAATYSITDRSLWALDVLAEEGYLYDSSVFPMHHDKYGIPEAPTIPHRLRTPGGNSIVEFPISVLRMSGLTLPVGGGGYFRILPYFLTRWGLDRLNARGQEFVFYIHPWEIDAFQPRIEAASRFSKFRHYSNIDACYHRLIKLLRDFSFAPLATVLQQKGFLATERIPTPVRVEREPVGAISPAAGAANVSAA